MSYASISKTRKGNWNVTVYSAGHVILSEQEFDGRDAAHGWAIGMGFEKIVFWD